jgi:hypothetical protein
MTRLIAPLVFLLSASPALANSWADYDALFPAFPCTDGWVGCVVGGKHVTLEPLRGDASNPMPANQRIDFVSLQATAAFSPFVSLSDYSRVSRQPAPEPPPPPPPPPVVPDSQLAVEPVPSAEPDAVAVAPDPTPVVPTPTPTASPEPSGGGVRPRPAEPAPPEPEVVAVAPTPTPGGGGLRPGSSMVRPTTLTPTPEPPKPEPVKPEPPEPPAPEPPAPEPPTPEPPAPVVAPPAPGGGGVRPGGDATAAVAEPSGPVTCDDLKLLEPPAMLGKLSAPQRTCLEGALQSAELQTEKKKISLLMMQDSWSKNDKAGWEKLVKRHLAEIDQSDPDVCYKYAQYLYRKGASRASGVIRWANVALENKTRWSGETFTSRVYNLLKLRAGAQNKIWMAAEEAHSKSPSADTDSKRSEARARTKVLAREWYDYAKGAGKDTTKALQLCVSAAGTQEYCEGG